MKYIKTTNDTMLSVQKSKVTIRDHKGTRNAPDEICLSITDYDASPNENDGGVDSFISMSKKDAIDLALTLLKLANS